MESASLLEEALARLVSGNSEFARQLAERDERNRELGDEIKLPKNLRTARIRTPAARPERPCREYKSGRAGHPNACAGGRSACRRRTCRT